MAGRPDVLSLRALDDTDIPLVEIWMSREHIRKWYDIPPVCTTEDWLAEIKGRYTEYAFITHFIAEVCGRPVGFCQFYACADAEEDWYGDIPLEGTYSIDYLIGEEAFLGKGMGKEMIALLAGKIFSLADAERIIVRPSEENTASCKVLRSNGFVVDPKTNVYVRTVKRYLGRNVDVV
jgi:RimJ/RimL family protein N-acetyltransferase